MNIEYYGTPLDQAGHGFHELSEGGIGSSRRRFEHLPFNPEGLPYRKQGTSLRLGTTQWHSFAGFTICAIEGSCYDKRGGSVTIFFVEEDIKFAEFEQRLKGDKAVMKIINKMPFAVSW